MIGAGVLLVIFLVIIVVILGGFGGGGKNVQALECTTAAIPSDVMDKINKNRSVYESAAQKQNIPWEMVAAVHYREGSCNPNQRLEDGDPLPPGETLQQSADWAAEHLKTMDKSVYNYDLSKVMSTSSTNVRDISYSVSENNTNPYGIWGCYAQTSDSTCGISDAQLAKYQGGGPAVFCSEAKGQKAKNDTIALGVPAEEMQNPGEQAMANMIRAEVAKQWAQVPENERHGSTQADAEKGVLIYAEGENEGLGHFNPDGSVHVEDCDGLSTLQPLSVTVDKYNGSYNSQIAAFWDQKYTIYLGVKENIDKFRQSAHGEGWARWENNWDVVFGGNTGWWVKGERLNRVKQKVDQLVVQDFQCSAAPENPEGNDSENAKIIKHAFLAYNRGSMYKNHGCTVDESPYVMNQFDDAHRDMHWPKSECEPKITREKEGPDIPLGAYTVYLILKGQVCTGEENEIIGGEIGQKVVAIAQQELKTMPCPCESGNVGPCPRKYGCGNDPWCACFVSWLYKEAGAPIGSASDWCHAYSGDPARLLPVHDNTPQPGDVWVRSPGDSYNNCKHTGIIEKIEGNTVYTLEGNTGDCIKEHTYSMQQFLNETATYTAGGKGKFHRAK
jgi:hypothetical protein